jgi:hypothetical protein
MQSLAAHTAPSQGHCRACEERRQLLPYELGVAPSAATAQVHADCKLNAALAARLLAEELGIPPAPEAVALRERLLAANTPGPVRARGDVARPAAVPANLVERDAELQELVTAVDCAVEDGRGVVVLISGEAGAGKSALLRGFRAVLRPDVRLVMGGCDDLLAPPSLAPFRDMATPPRRGCALAAFQPASSDPGRLRAAGRRVD